ncbi:hypothetical protein CLCR_02114 [Cladophialophora carrionii]|uniref:Uncharacterized protein n=1 Tax=Cladophialophora carrionii TaxID=86049 RepID=A0A1C1CEC6_9EURO|nr:hypothetical protein CLCR_02114 [Cladophialophora carrionii]
MCYTQYVYEKCNLCCCVHEAIVQTRRCIHYEGSIDLDHTRIMNSDTATRAATAAATTSAHENPQSWRRNRPVVQQPVEVDDTVSDGQPRHHLCIYQSLLDLPTIAAAVHTCFSGALASNKTKFPSSTSASGPTTSPSLAPNHVPIVTMYPRRQRRF